jgi:putative ABC transport system substrate-binding protein
MNSPLLKFLASISSACLFGILTLTQAAVAQERPKVGVLFAGQKGSAAITAFVKAMEDLGYQDGKTVVLEYRYAEGKADQLPLLANELVQQHPRLIVGVASEAAVALAKATSTIPIVSATGDVDFVGLGLAKSLDKPGGNITGVTISAGEAAQLRVELLQKIVPGLSTLIVLMHPSNSANQRLLNMMDDVAKRLGVKIQPVSVGRPKDLEGAIATAKASGAQAISSLQGPFFFFQRKLLGDLCEAHMIALAMSEPLSAEVGALLQVNPDVSGAAAAFGFPSHRPPVDRSGPRRASDPGAVRQTIPQGAQERCAIRMVAEIFKQPRNALLLGFRQRHSITQSVSLVEGST